MEFDVVEELPSRIDVAQLVSSRYSGSAGIAPARPLSWDERSEGTDVVQTTEGKRIKLWSDGQQSPPLSGWGLILTSGDPQTGYRWTLYAMPKGAGLADSPRF